MQIAGSLQGVVTQALLPTADGTGRVPALEILLPDDAVRNLIRQGKVEQIYSVMQTGTRRACRRWSRRSPSWSLRGVVTIDLALSRSSRPEQLLGLLERAGLRPERRVQRARAAAGAAPAAGRRTPRGGGLSRGRLEERGQAVRPRRRQEEAAGRGGPRGRRSRRAGRQAGADLDLEEGALVRPQEAAEGRDRRGHARGRGADARARCARSRRARSALRARAGRGPAARRARPRAGRAGLPRRGAGRSSPTRTSSSSTC